MLTYSLSPPADRVIDHGYVPTEMVKPRVLFARLTMRRVEAPYWPTYRVVSSIDVARAIGLVNPVIVPDTVLVAVLMTDTEPDP